MQADDTATPIVLPSKTGAVAKEGPGYQHSAGVFHLAPSNNR
jgi:hypothetical protein